MSRCTIIAPRALWPLILDCIEPIPRTTALWFRELKPDEIQKYPADIDSDLENPIYLVGLQYAVTTTPEAVDLIQSRLHTKWPYVRAEPERSLLF